MSRNLFAFLLSELKTVRIVCEKCKGTAEMTIEQLGQRSDLYCPACRSELAVFSGRSQPHPLATLVKSIDVLQKGVQPPFQVEFILPDENETA
jgi:hypothetical protein